jgi:hypothetical protein
MMVFPLPLSSLGLLSILTYRYCFLEHFPKHSGPPPSAGVASRRFPAQPPPLCRCCLFLLPALLFIPALIGVRLMTTERRKRLDGARSPEGTPVLGGDRLRQRLIRDDPTHRLLFFLLACLAYSLVLLATFTFCNDPLSTIRRLFSSRCRETVILIFFTSIHSHYHVLFPRFGIGRPRHFPLPLHFIFAALSRSSPPEWNGFICGQEKGIWGRVVG